MMSLRVSIIADVRYSVAYLRIQLFLGLTRSARHRPRPRVIRAGPIVTQVA